MVTAKVVQASSTVLYLVVMVPLGLLLYGGGLVKPSWLGVAGYGMLAFPLVLVSTTFARGRFALLQLFVGVSAISGLLTSLLGILGITTGGSSLGAFLGPAFGLLTVLALVWKRDFSKVTLVILAIGGSAILAGAIGVMLAAVTRGSIWVTSS